MPFQRKPTADPAATQCCGVLVALLLVGIWSGGIARAQTPGTDNTATSQAPVAAVSDHRSEDATPYWANRGRWNFGVQLGYAVENAIPQNISHINMLIAQPQVRFIVHDFRSGPIRRFEIINEGILGGAVHPGGNLLGNSVFLHFDTKAYRHWVPFINLGSGILHTTLASRAPELSGNLQFMSQAGAGVQYFFAPQRAIVFEYRYLHMSNAGIEQPNLGFNASMISVGFRWLRRP